LAGRVAAWLPSYATDLKAALRFAARDGFRGVHADTAGTELEPREFSQSARRHLKRYLGELGLRLGSLYSAHPGSGLADPQWGEERFEQFRRTLEMCAEMRVGRAGVALHGLEDEARSHLAGEMLEAVAEVADRYGIDVSVHVGHDEAAATAEAIRRLGCRQLHVGSDSAELAGGKLIPAPTLESVQTLHLRDVRRVGQQVEEVPFGRGEVDFAGIIGGLAEHSGDCDLVVRRDGAQGIDALRQGREYIERLLGGIRRS